MAPLALVLMVIGCWQALYGVDPAWLGRAQDTEIVLGTFGTLIVGPASIASACWTVYRADRAGFGDVVFLGMRSALAKLALPAVAVWGWACLALVVPMVLGLLRTWFSSGATPGLLLFVLPLGVLAAQVAFGVAAGTLLGRSMISCILAPLAFYVVYFFHVAQGMQDPGWRRLLPILQEIWDPLYVVDTWRVLGVLLFLFAASMSILVVCSVLRFRALPAGRRLSGGVFTLAVVTGVALSFTPPASSSSYYGQQRAGSSYACQSRVSVRVCVWEPDAVLLPGLLDALSQAIGPERTAAGLPRTLIEEGIQLDAREREYGETALISPPNLTAAADEVKATVLNGLGPFGTDCQSARPPASLGGTEAHHFFARVLGDRMGLKLPYEVDTGTVRSFQALPIPVQDIWLGAARTAMSTCQSVPPLPGEVR